MSKSNFSKKASTGKTLSEVVVQETSGNKRFKTCYVDSDTFLFRCAKLTQEDYVEVRHTKSGRTMEFRNKTSFGIRSGNIIELTEDDISTGKREVEKVLMGNKSKEPYKWLAWKNFDQEQKESPPFTLEDFEVFEKARLNKEFDTVEKALDTAEMIFASNVRGVKDNMDSEDYVLCISSGNGNYRNEESKTIGYKSKRGDKPLYFEDLKERISETYKSKIWWTDNNEAEDYIQYIAKRQEAIYGSDRSLWDSCACWVDKDVNMCFITHKNFDKYEEGWIEYDRTYCELTLASQTLAGDPTDTIEGLPTLTDVTTKHFGLRKAKGVSKATAEKLLLSSKTFQEMWERVVFCYQEYYGFDKSYKFKDVHGEEQNWTWLDYMQQCYVLVKMQEYKGQIPCIRKYLSHIGVDVTKEVKYGEVEIDTEGLVENLKVCNCTLAELEITATKYKSLGKPKLIEKLEETAKLVTELKGNLSLLEK